jgi:hypothetical protein
MRRFLHFGTLALLSMVALVQLAGPSLAAYPSSYRDRFYERMRRQRALNNAVVAYAQNHLGQQIGNGECWTLVDEALRSAGADTSGDSNYVFGTPVSLSYLMGGDVIQFENARFDHRSGSSTSWMEFPHHTAIVESVQGRTVTLLNQNVNGDRHVQRSTINLDELTRGSLTAYRPKLK